MIEEIQTFLWGRFGSKAKHLKAIKKARKKASRLKGEPAHRELISLEYDIMGFVIEETSDYIKIVDVDDMQVKKIGKRIITDKVELPDDTEDGIERDFKLKKFKYNKIIHNNADTE